MAKTCYVPKKFNAESQRLIGIINQIVRNWSSQGYSLTTRQVYYQLVTMNEIPNVNTSYSKVQGLLNDARLAGEVDWDAIVDRTRATLANRHWKHPRDIISEGVESFQMWKWEDQPNYVEVWVEKDALKDIVAQACSPLDVPYFSCRGYTSVSAIHEAAMRFKYEIQHGKTIRIIHLGDHDPSGLDMTRDIKARLSSVFGVPVNVYRVALNMNQIEEYNPPPNPAKMTDSRAERYVEEHGTSSWELDALQPNVLDRIITKNICHWRDDEKWEKAVAKEKRAKSLLGMIHNRWGEVHRLLQAPPREQAEEEEE